MLPASTERILASLDPDATLLDVGGWGAPFNRATHVLDVMPYATRGVMGSYGPGPERFDETTWVQRDFCDREPWPWPDDFFDFSLCVTTLEDVRDPIWVCSELSRVSRAGYVEMPTIWAELMFGVAGDGPYLGHPHHRWLCEPGDEGELVFTHKPHSLHHDWRVRVVPRWFNRLPVEEQLFGVFWEGELRAREELHIWGFDHDELARRLRARFAPSPAELRLKAGRDRLRRLTGKTRAPLQRALDRLLGTNPRGG